MFQFLRNTTMTIWAMGLCLKVIVAVIASFRWEYEEEKIRYEQVKMAFSTFVSF